MSDIRLDDPELLDFTQDVRQRIVEKLIARDGEITTDVKELTVVLKTLEGMDKQVFSKAKQKSLEKQVDNDALAKEMILKMFEHMDANRDDFVPTAATGEIPEPELDDGDVPEGAMEIGISDEGYNEFNKRMDK